MNTDPNLENEQDLAKRIESSNSSIESNAENKEADVLRGAELLENPENGDFVGALKTFVDWVKNLFAK
jgi:hypothetical protein